MALYMLTFPHGGSWDQQVGCVPFPWKVAFLKCRVGTLMWLSRIFKKPYITLPKKKLIITI